VKHRIEHWYIAPLPGARGVTIEALEQGLFESGVKDRAIHRFPSVNEAFSAAKSAANEADRILVFGSFLTVAACSA
jgi:dihydrofolate synthase / folylpolyglutamate synthase